MRHDLNGKFYTYGSEAYNQQLAQIKRDGLEEDDIIRRATNNAGKMDPRLLPSDYQHKIIRSIEEERDFIVRSYRYPISFDYYISKIIARPLSIAYILILALLFLAFAYTRININVAYIVIGTIALFTLVIYLVVKESYNEIKTSSWQAFYTGMVEGSKADSLKAYAGALNRVESKGFLTKIE